MIDLTSKGLPNTINVNGRLYSIYTDFRIWMRLAIQLQHLKNGDTIDVAYLFKNEHPPRISIENDLLPFLYPKQELPRRTGKESDAILIDYELDADLIWAAILGQYGVDLCEVEELHWWKFRAMISGLNESTKLHEVMSFRCYEKRRDNSDPYEELRRAWEIVKEPEGDGDAFSKLFEVPEQGQQMEN